MSVEVKGHIQMTPSEEHFNQHGGLEVPGCWTTVMKKCEVLLNQCNIICCVSCMVFVSRIHVVLVLLIQYIMMVHHVFISVVTYV